MASPSAPVIPALDNTFGCMLIGVLLSSALWGICCVQAYYYSGRYKQDKLAFKLGVVLVVLLDTTHQVLIGHTIYTYVISNFFNPAYLNVLEWSLGLQVLFCGLTAAFVQSFFAFRVYVLSNKNRPVTAVLGALILAGLVLSFVYVATALRIPTISEGSHKLKPLSLAVNAVGASADLYIAVCMCWNLKGSKTGFEKSNSLVTRLMYYSINTGVLTAGCAVCSLALILSHPNTLLYVPFYFTVGRLYSNSMLATLNARKSFQNSFQGREVHVALDSDRRKSFAIGGLSAIVGEKPTININTSKRGPTETISMDIAEIEYEMESSKSPLSDRSSTIDDLSLSDVKKESLDSPV